MSSIQSNSVVVRGLLALKRDWAKAENGPPKRAGEGADRALSHAWTIGTTRAAQPGAAEDQKRESHVNQCPPEVYIG